MHIGASAALESPNIASRSAEEWISEETSRADAAPAPDDTAEASSAWPGSPAAAEPAPDPADGATAADDATGATAGRQPGRQRVAAGACREAELAAGAAQDRGSADALARRSVIIVAERRQHAVACEIADVADHAGLAIADQAQ